MPLDISTQTNDFGLRDQWIMDYDGDLVDPQHDASLRDAGLSIVGDPRIIDFGHNCINHALMKAVPGLKLARGQLKWIIPSQFEITAEPCMKSQLYGEALFTPNNYQPGDFTLLGYSFWDEQHQLAHRFIHAVYVTEVNDNIYIDNKHDYKHVSIGNLQAIITYYKLLTAIELTHAKIYRNLERVYKPATIES